MKLPLPKIDLEHVVDVLAQIPRISHERIKQEIHRVRVHIILLMRMKGLRRLTNRLIKRAWRTKSRDLMEEEEDSKEK